MNKLLLFIFLLCSFASLSQETDTKMEMQSDSIDYAGIHIALPKTCMEGSTNDIRDCGCTQIQWYIFPSMKELEEYFPKAGYSYEKGYERSEFKARSFGSLLTGYRYKYTSGKSEEYVFQVFGEVNHKPILLYISSKTDIQKNTVLTSLLGKLITPE